MRIDFDLALCGASSWLPEAVETTADAVASGRIDAASAAELGVDSIHIADEDLLPADMAVPASHQALAAADRRGSQVGLLMHCYVWHQGYDLWCAPHYLARRLGAANALPLTLSQGCNAAMAAIELAVPWLAHAPSEHCVLITAADRFLAPGFDRWQGAYGCVYGDGAAAAVLRRGPVPKALAVRAISSLAVPKLEEINRAGLQPTTAARMNGENVDLRAPKRAYFQRHGVGTFQRTTETAIRKVVEESLADAHFTPDDQRIRGIAVPRLSAAIVRDVYAAILATITPAPVVPMQHHTGHLSCADILANVADLHSDVLRRPGDVGIVLNVGGGYTWSSLVVEVPQW